MSLEKLSPRARFLNPESGIEKSYQEVYENGQIKIGREVSPPNKDARQNTYAIVGGALGDEGKGRFVDNCIDEALDRNNIDRAYIVRFQGGNNSGHTVENNGRSLKLHLLPSGVFYPNAIGVIDNGVVVHPEDLATEIAYVENEIGRITERLILSENAILATDLERAEEKLNNIRAEKSGGGTGRGIGPAYAHHLDRRGLIMRELLKKDWRETLSDQYDNYAKDFHGNGLSLQDTLVPDFAETLATGKDSKRKVGNKWEFLERMAEARQQILDIEIAKNTLPIHHEIYARKSAAVVFEGAQAVGLDAWLGTRPDVTASNTRVYGVSDGTGFWKKEDIEQTTAVIKVPYTSSVGSRRMPTHVELPQNLDGLPEDATAEQQWAAWVRKEAHEYGTTTGRPRDINHLDLSMLTHNLHMSGVDTVAVTHLDVARGKDEIKISTHYTDGQENVVIYQPDLERLKEVVPTYISLPGWEGKDAQNAKTKTELPENALLFLSFLQDRLGYPIIAATTGPARDNFISFER